MPSSHDDTINQNEHSVQDRLLDAAEKLFCNKGFDRTSVRDLTREASCNIAAINYHFGGKNQLYAEMFRRQIKIVITECIEAIDCVMSGPSPSLEALIRSWVTPPLKAIERNEPRGRVLQLMVRELLDQQVNLMPIFEDLKKVFLIRMSEAFRQLEPDLNKQDANLAVFSMDALMLHPFLFMPFYVNWIKGLNPNRIIDHIVRFGAAGIRGYVRKDS